MNYLITSSLVLGAALVAVTTSRADVILSSTFDNNTGAAVATGGVLGVNGSTTLNITYTGAESGTASALTAITPTFGFAYITGSANATTNVATISNNENSTPTSDPRGYSLTFTPTLSYDLGTMDIYAGRLTGTGGLQTYNSTLTLSLLDGTTTVFTANKANNLPYLPNQPPQLYTFDLTGTSLSSGVTYTLEVTDHNLTSGGGFATYDGFTLNTSAVPEPTTLALVGCGALAWFGVRRRKS